MLDRLFGFKIHDYLQALGLFILAFGVPMNKVLMSIGTIWLASNLLLKADFSNYWKRWKTNPIFWFILSTFVLHVLGMTYTENLAYAFRDMNTKLPLFVIPTALIAFPIQKKYIDIILYGFLASLLMTSIINFWNSTNQSIEDYRDLSLFGSHIRYSLLVVTGVLIAVYFWIKNRRLWFVYLLLSVWFFYYTLISQVFSGYIAMAFLLLGFFLYFLQKVKRTSVRRIAGILFLLFCIVVGKQSYNYVQESTIKYDFGDLPERTVYGHLYYHDTTAAWFENGHHVISYIAGDELRESWAKRSDVDFDTTFNEKYSLESILIRYMASKGLKKDRDGMLLMTDHDIQNVEKGVPTILNDYSPIKRRQAKIKNEILQYLAGGDPDGNSLLQRIEHWKAGASILKNNWAFGVGTGDVQAAFDYAYENSTTQLDKENWNRAHNQFMTFWISFGVFGFLIFTGFWLWFLWQNIKLNKLIGIGFALIAIASFLSEDTIETQQGVTYISLFLGLCSLMNASELNKTKEQ